MSQERIAQIQAHRATHSAEHDVPNGKIHGYCIVCGVPFPCAYVGLPPVENHPAPTVHGLDAQSVMLKSLREAQTVVLDWMVPGSQVTAEKAMTDLLPILDNKTLVLAMRACQQGGNQ